MNSLPAPPAKSVVRMVFEDAETAQAVYSSIKPDDKPLPKGLEVETSLDGNTVVVTVECRRMLASLLATLDDVLSMAALSEKIYKMLKSV